MAPKGEPPRARAGRSPPSATRPTESMLHGTLNMLVLRALQLGPMHGWGITDRIRQGSEHTFDLNQGSLYPALYQLERERLIASEWGTTENSRRARYYSLTPAGRARLAEYRALWERVSGAVNLVLRMKEP